MKLSELTLVESLADVSKAVKYLKDLGVVVDAKPIENKPGLITFNVPGKTGHDLIDVLDKSAEDFFPGDKRTKKNRLAIGQGTNSSSGMMDMEYFDNTGEDMKRGIVVKNISKTECTISVFDADHQPED